MPSFDTWENELYHHGILGMKWGVRRFQNEDGSLTSAGRKHYGYGSSEASSIRKQAKLERIQYKEKLKTERENAKAAYKAQKQQQKLDRKIKIKDMNDEELKKRISRLELEKKYKDLKKENSALTTGKEIAEKVLSIAATHMANKLKDKELTARIKESEAKATVAIENRKQAKQNRKQAKESRKNAHEQMLRDTVNKRKNIKLANNERRKISLLRKMFKTSSDKKSDIYKQYMAGEISIDEVLGLTKKQKDKKDD